MTDLQGKVNKDTWFSTTVGLLYGRATDNVRSLYPQQSLNLTVSSDVSDQSFTQWRYWKTWDLHSMVLIYSRQPFYDNNIHKQHETGELKNQACRLDLKIKWLQDHFQKGQAGWHSSADSSEWGGVMREYIVFLNTYSRKYVLTHIIYSLHLWIWGHI
jgi:hypothetical protein